MKKAGIKGQNISYCKKLKMAPKDILNPSSLKHMKITLYMENVINSGSREEDDILDL